MKRVLVTALAVSLASGAAFSQIPALSTNWVDMNLSQADCLAHAERIMRNAGLRRVERVQQSVFADTADGQNQVAIRCASDRRIAFFAAAGPRESATDALVTMLASSFRESR